MSNTNYGHAIYLTESYWLRGFKDGYAAREATPPNHNGRWDRQNEGYHNGYKAGALRYAKEAAAIRSSEEGERT